MDYIPAARQNKQTGLNAQEVRDTTLHSNEDCKSIVTTLNQYSIISRKSISNLHFQLKFITKLDPTFSATHLEMWGLIKWSFLSKYTISSVPYP